GGKQRAPRCHSQLIVGRSPFMNPPRGDWRSRSSIVMPIQKQVAAIGCPSTPYLRSVNDVSPELPHRHQDPEPFPATKPGTMFSKDRKTGAAEVTAFPAPDAARRGNGGATQSIISRDLKIKGDLICNGEIHIDGEVEGDVQSRSITIGEGADVRGTISSDSI